MRAPLCLVLLTGCFGTSKIDADGDGLSDAEERARGLDPTVADGDGDGTSDGDELRAGTTPYAATPSSGHALVDAPPDAKRCPEEAGQYDCFERVEGGTFSMGAQATDASAPGYDAHAVPTEGPVHRVTVATFWIQRHEVSALSYNQCLESGWCDQAHHTAGDGGTLGRADMHEHPINLVSWAGAARYCAWIGARLPTEAEWEFAARGTASRVFPWGDDPGCGYHVSPPDKPWNRTMVTGPCEGSGPRHGRDLFGTALDSHAVGMAGNVWEWVADWYDPAGYASADATNPTGPASGTLKIQRGGSWIDSDPWSLRSAARNVLPPDMMLHDAGFRCAWGSLP